MMAVGLKKTGNGDIPRTSMMAAVFFLGSLVHIPLGPTTAHMLLAGLIVLFIGWSAAPAVFLALILQALIFGFGGVSTLGPNTFQVVAPALLVGIPLRKMALSTGWKSRAAAFAVGALGAFGTSAMVYGNLCLSNPDLAGAAYLGFVGNCIVSAIEGPVTMFAIAWIKRSAPTVLGLSPSGEMVEK